MKSTVIILLMTLLSSAVVKAAPLVIVADGQARAEIVIATNDSLARLAAEGLQPYIEKMSGAKLAIRPEQEPLSQAIGIYVGHTQKAKENRIKIP